MTSGLPSRMTSGLPSERIQRGRRPLRRQSVRLPLSVLVGSSLGGPCAGVLTARANHGICHGIVGSRAIDIPRDCRPEVSGWEDILDVVGFTTIIYALQYLIRAVARRQRRWRA